MNKLPYRGCDFCKMAFPTDPYTTCQSEKAYRLIITDELEVKSKPIPMLLANKAKNVRN